MPRWGVRRAKRSGADTTIPPGEGAAKGEETRTPGRWEPPATWEGSQRERPLSPISPLVPHKGKGPSACAPDLYSRGIQAQQQILYPPNQSWPLNPLPICQGSTDVLQNKKMMGDSMEIFAQGMLA